MEVPESIPEIKVQSLQYCLTMHLIVKIFRTSGDYLNAIKEADKIISELKCKVESDRASDESTLKDKDL